MARRKVAARDVKVRRRPLATVVRKPAVPVVTARLPFANAALRGADRTVKVRRAIALAAPMARKKTAAKGPMSLQNAKRR